MSGLIGQSLGQYEIVALLGKGGMATVYRARQKTVKRDVAIKVIKPDLAESGDFVQRFEREAETIASLSHPHILKLFDYGQSGDLLYLVMELLSGGSLADLLRKGPLAVEDILTLSNEVASALDYAHKRGIVHRDLKPQNILLDDNGHAFLSDFGIAKLLTEHTALTQSGATMGTPAYMAPEQWQGQGVDARTDVYALGIILFEMLVGKLPFQADTPFSMMNKHVNELPPSITHLRSSIPSQVDKVISKALSKKPEDRFPSASALVVALKAALTSTAPDMPTVAALPSTQEGVETTRLPTKHVRERNGSSRLFVMVGGVVIIVTIGLLALSTSKAPQQNAQLPGGLTGSAPGASSPVATATLDCQAQNQTLVALQTAIVQSTLDSARFQATVTTIKQTLSAAPRP